MKKSCTYTSAFIYFCQYHRIANFLTNHTLKLTIKTLNKQAILNLGYLNIMYQQWKCHVGSGDFMYLEIRIHFTKVIKNLT